MSRATTGAHGFVWLAGGATILAFATCAGTQLPVGMLSLMGATLVVVQGASAGAISALVLLAVMGVLLGYRHHRAPVPLILALVGAALVLWVMLGRDDRLMELAGFAALAAASAWDWRLKRANRKQEN
jgi:hypothetical protein